MSSKLKKYTKKIDVYKLDPFIRQYIETALWSSHDESDKSGDESMDTNYGIEDVAQETLQKMADDCRSFQEENAKYLRDYPDEQAGHDFWLTRNGHGAGFWDRGERYVPLDIEQKLTDSAHTYGEVDLYVGYDGLIHQG